MNVWIDWALANWALILVALSVVSTVLVKVIDFYGDDHPALRRFLRFVLSLLSLLPARNATGRGVRLLVGAAEVQIPGMSWSKGGSKSVIVDRVRKVRG